MTPGSTTPSTSTGPKLNKDGTPRKQRKRSPRALKGCAKKQSTSEKWKKLWADPEWAAMVREKSRAGREARKADKTKRMNRVGVPDGMRAAEAEEHWAKARELARKFIKIMEDNGEVEKIVIPGSEEEMAKRALEEAFVMAVSPLSNAQTKNASIRTVLEWTKSKPESKSKLTVNKAEEFLAELHADMQKDNDASAE